MDLPLITEADYEAFRELMGYHLSYTYDEWLNLRSQWLAEYASDGPRNVSIHADQFRRFIALTGRAPDMNALLAFAESVGKGEAY